MSKKILQNSLGLIVFVSICSISYGTLTGDEIDQKVSKNAIGVVHTGKGDVHIGITLEQYEKGLKEREKDVMERLEKAHASERKSLQASFDMIQKKSLDLGNSYKEHIQDLQKRITQLESIRGQVPSDLLDQAQSALAQGDTHKAEEIFKEVEQQSQGAITATAEAKYQRCKIEEDNINYYEAISLCKRAVQLVPENILYLSATGGEPKDLLQTALTPIARKVLLCSTGSLNSNRFQ